MGHKPATPEVKNFLRRIGSIGGRRSSQHPNRRNLNRAAANSRWQKEQPAPKKIIENNT
jgi:hypothetical protein